MTLEGICEINSLKKRKKVLLLFVWAGNGLNLLTLYIHFKCCGVTKNLESSSYISIKYN